MKPTRLRCEHLEGVPLIDPEAPRLGWTIEAEGRGRRQGGYRVLVAKSAAELARGEGGLWDSGKVESPRTFDVIYTGRPLEPGSEYVWTVRLYDELNEESPWAEPARFRTGISSWSAEWIACDRREHLGFSDPGAVDDPDEMLFRCSSAPYLRRTFDLEEPVRRATLYATARGVLELQINGRRVGDAELAPGWTDYRTRIEYAAHDVTDLLGAGENVLGCILGDGWYAGFVGFEAKHPAAIYGSAPELLCELHLDLPHGGQRVIRSDGSWRATPAGPILYSDLQQGERYDARRELTGWSKPGYVDDWWDPVTVKELDEAALVPEKGPPIRVTEELHAVSITERAPKAHVFDLGQNIVGRVRLRTEGERGTRIELRFGEVLDGDGSVYMKNLLDARQVDLFILCGKGIEQFEPRFTFHGFRYVEVCGLAAEPDEATVVGRVIRSDTPWTSTFSCSNAMANQLHSNICWGQRGNFLSVPTDCPQRSERVGWLADAQVFLPTASLNADIAAFMTKWGEDILDGLSPEGVYPDYAPRVAQQSDGAPAWADGGIVMPALLFERYGDRRLLERHWPHMERYMAYLLKHNPNLLWSRRRNRDFGDWLAIGEETPKELLATAFWANDARLMARIGRVLGRRDRVEHYERLFGAIASAFNVAYVGEDATIEGDTQTGYLLALAFELLPEEDRARAAERLVANIERRDWHLTTGFIGVGLLCPVLTEWGYADIAHRLFLQTTFPSWGYSIGKGATTIWERWDGIREDGSFQSERMNSFNHYSLGSIGVWMIESLLGIRNGSESVAYEHVHLEPVPGSLDWAKGSFRSVRGEIDSEWEQTERCFRFALTVPPNVTGTVVLPIRGEALTEGGAPAGDADGVLAVARENSTWRIEVCSGRYEFESA